ncbi:hypothetical protein V2J09_008213 [Rumex salicifolius]
MPMSGNMKCELSSGSPQDSGFAGSYVNGSRGAHQAANLDRIGSFRENISGRVFSSGASISKGKAGDLPPISQCLSLDPITLGDQKYTRNGELRRALGYSFGSASEENSIGAAHSKPAPVLGVDDLKRFRASIQDGNDKARSRVNERSSGSNMLRTGAQSHRKSPDHMSQKMDDMGKSALSKRIRTPVADMRLEGRVSAISRQHMVLGKDKDINKQGSLSSESMEEKIRKLPAGGESWDKKMKRKRSVSNVISKPVDGDGEAKRAMHSRVSSDSGLPSSDAPPIRSASCNGIGSNIKHDSTPTASISGIRTTAKNEMEKVSLSRELGGMNKERILQKGSNKLNLRDENLVANPSLLTKGKASRGHRAGTQIMDNSSPTFSRMAGTPEDWEQPSNLNKIHSLGGINNRKRVFSSESSSPPVTQWVGQRQQKNSRVRRTNIVSPTSNNDEALVSSEGSPAPDFGATTSSGFNGSFPAWSIPSNPQPLKGKSENAPSPARLSDSEEICAVENSLKERKAGSGESEEKGINGYQHVGSPGLILKKNKLPVKEEIGDGVRRLGRSGRGSSFPRGGMSPLREKLDSPAAVKPVRSTKPGSDKNGSKSGRPPLKKHMERKGFTRLGLLPNGNSPDCTGESDDDREDLTAAAQFASSANDNACSSPFWKKVEPLFSSREDDRSYLKQQLKLSEEYQDSSSQMYASANNKKDVLEGEKHQPIGYQGEKVALSNGVESTNSKGLAEQGRDSGFYCRKDSEEGSQGLTPLYQRVLSALIMEDELEEFERTNCGRSPSFSGGELGCITEEKLFSNGDTSYSRSSNIDIPCQLDLWEGERSFMHSEGLLPASYQGNLKGPITPQINICDDSSSLVQYAQMSIDEKLLIELQSIGLHPESVPDLAEGEDEVLEETLQLQKQLRQVGPKKKLCLGKMLKVMEEEKDGEERVLEQVAMNKLIESAHRKLRATRGNTAAKMGVSKVQRHVAMSFARRTLARCRRLEDTGKSCFSEPTLRDLLLSTLPSSSKAETNKPVSLADHNLQSEPNAPGSNPSGTERGLIESNDSRPHQSDHPLDNRGKKKEISLDDVNNGFPFLKPSPLGNAPMGGSAKGKRSDRDRDRAGRGERKAKPKPKQRASNLSSTHPVYPSPSGSRANGNILDSSEEAKDAADLTNLPLNELESIGIGVEGNQDLGSWLNFDEDNLQDHDSVGLEIPMDDLSDLNMF